MSKGGPLDRELQRALLLQMQDIYPRNVVRFSGVGPLAAVGANIAYLSEHGLCRVEGPNSAHGLGPTTITRAGLDFLADDGGLSAILGVVTVKLHPDTIRDLIAAKIDASPLHEEKKAGLRAALAKLPAAALQEGSKRLMNLGMDHIGDVETWLHHPPGAFGL